MMVITIELRSTLFTFTTTLNNLLEKVEITNEATLFVCSSWLWCPMQAYTEYVSYYVNV